MKQKLTDEQISVIAKNRIAEALEKKGIDVNTLVQIINAFSKLRGVELKQEEGEFGSDLPVETVPEDLAKGLRQ